MSSCSVLISKRRFRETMVALAGHQGQVHRIIGFVGSCEVPLGRPFGQMADLQAVIFRLVPTATNPSVCRILIQKEPYLRRS